VRYDALRRGRKAERTFNLASNSVESAFCVAELMILRLLALFVPPTRKARRWPNGTGSAAARTSVQCKMRTWRYASMRRECRDAAISLMKTLKLLSRRFVQRMASIGRTIRVESCPAHARMGEHDFTQLMDSIL